MTTTRSTECMVDRMTRRAAGRSRAACGRRAWRRALSTLVRLASIASFASFASSAGAATRVEAQVMAVTQAACDAFRSRDVAALDALLAPDFTLVGPDASVQPRGQAIAEVRAGEPRYTVFRNHDMTAHVHGDAAVVQGTTSLEGTAGGSPFAVDVRFTDTLFRVHGRWTIVVSHVTRIPPR